jgi:integrase
MRGHIRKRGNKWAVVVEPTRQTVGGFLRDWVPAIEATVRAGTWRSYRTNMERHVIPRIGHVPLRQLGPAHLNALYAQLLRSGRHDGNGGLSPRTVRYTHTILHRALRDAVRWGILSRNPADLADPPRHQRPTLSVWTAEELRTFLRSTGDDRLHALWVTLAMTGLRRGEALALRWADIDFNRRRVSISRSLTSAGGKLTFAEPKTARSRRSLAVDSDTLGELRTHRRRQLEERVAWAGPHDDADLVFARDDGSPLRPDSVSRRFIELAKAAGVPRIRVHDLRHTHATLALEAGVNPKVVSERLGHSSVAFTLDVYSHVVPALDEEAANRVARLITGA